MQVKSKVMKAALAVLCLGVFFVPQVYVSAAAPSKIDSFDATIRMNADSSVDIEERIEYDVGSQLTYWIYHYIPVRYILSDRGNVKYTLRLSDVSVTDADGKPCGFVVSDSDSGASKEIKIGGNSAVLAGKKTYVIRYRLEYPVKHDKNHDELFWNVTGDSWTVPITQVNARVIYPTSIKTGGEDSGMECYAGLRGSRGPCDRAEYVFPDSQSLMASGIVFSASDLKAREGMTFIVYVPEEVIEKPGLLSYIHRAAEDGLAILAVEGWVFVFPFLIFIRMFLIWYKRGRDPKGRETIIPEYDIPDNLTPAELGLIMDEQCGQREIVSEIIFLADKKYLSIDKTEDGDYIFKKLKDPRDFENVFDRELAYGVLKGCDMMKLSHLKGNFSAYGSITGALFQAVYEKGYFHENPRRVIARYSSWAFLIFFALMFGLSTLGNMEDAGLEPPISPRLTFFLVLSLVLSMIIITTFAKIIPKKTDKGVLIKEHILGFREYLRIAEKERLEFHNAPGGSTERFEKLLPYAIALGVTEDWIAPFNGLCEVPSSSPKGRLFVRRYYSFLRKYFR